MSRTTAFGALIVVAMLAVIAAAMPASAAVDATSATGGTLRIWTDKDRKADIERIANAWGSRRGVNVEVVEKGFGDIRDQLKTVQPATAPDVIIGAHDWTGQLAADGLVLPITPSAATKRQFPKYALDAFSYGSAVKRLYGAPVALENIGLVVNTRLAQVPTTWAQLEQRALAFKRRSADNLAIAVPQAPAGDAYHMYPFFSGLGGFVFGKNRAGNLNPRVIGVANPVFLRNAPMIDRWDRLGLINSKVNYDTAKNAFLKGQAAFWITGPWEADTLKSSGLRFRIVQLPRIKFRSVPFLGVQGFMVTRHANTHGVASLAKDLVASYIMTPASQRALAAANGRFPANTVAGRSVRDTVLAQFGRAGAGGVPMPNIPQMSSVWEELGGAWLKSTNGTATNARPTFQTAARNIRTKMALPGPRGGGRRGDGRPRRTSPPGGRLSTTAARAEAPPPQRISLAQAALALPARAVAFFSGPLGVAIKMLLLGLMNALAVWAAIVLADEGKWPAFIVLAITTIAIDVAYLVPRALPLKFLIPGTVLMLAFQVIPIFYTLNVAFTNYSTGHILAKNEAIDGIKLNSLAPPDTGKSYLMAPARDEDGELVLLLLDEESGNTFVGTREALTPIDRNSVEVDDLGIAGAEGYTLVLGPELIAIDRELTEYTVPTGGASAIRPEGLGVAAELAPTLRYDEAQDRFVRISDGVVFSDNGKGSFTAASGEELEPGWKTAIGFSNFSKIIHNPLVRDPFLRVFVWTFVFALSAVFLSFILGLLLAIALDKPGMRFQRSYRTLLILPYAIPGFLSLLVWQGLLNDEFGVVNRVTGLDVPWLFDANWAKVSVILVSVWLTFPYFFLVSLGALQSIPAELTEAARVDGGGPWAVFRRVTLPLLLIVVAPLMIASFAFNFNNFGNIYFLTGGGPQSSDQTTAGDTDILISYTYKLAFASGKGQDYGLASAVALIIFFIVATISSIAFWRTNALENIR